MTMESLSISIEVIRKYYYGSPIYVDSNLHILAVKVGAAGIWLIQCTPSQLRSHLGDCYNILEGFEHRR